MPSLSNSCELRSFIHALVSLTLFKDFISDMLEIDFSFDFTFTHLTFIFVTRKGKLQQQHKKQRVM